jgi:hypothetical protein
VRRHVSDHGVDVPALGVEVGIRVVLRDSPNPVLLVPEGRPAQVLGEKRGDLSGSIGSGYGGHVSHIHILVHLVH